MKKTALILLALIMLFSFACCGAQKTPSDATTYRSEKDKAMVSLGEGEMFLVATVKEVNGNSLLLVVDSDKEYVFDYSENVKVVEDGYYINDITADYFSGKNVTVIASDKVQETYPMGLSGERLIIVG